MSEKLATTGEFRVARPASKRSRWWIRQRPRSIEAKIERLVDKAVADRLERIELEHRALWPDSTTYGTMKGIVKILHTIGGGNVIMQVGEMTRPYQSPKPLVGGLLYDLDITGNTKGQFQVSPVQAAEASQTKVFKVARIDRSKAQLPEVSVADAEASGRRKTRALFGLPEDE
ncbi:hypothetical protein [Burkholderia gladioli]|uniref:hypothetical protein n=1 Tax=Burkholderia gladioli TaxID=28095 RepID=UPI0005C78837|nr:hypothetical protein [Burkholderia gladioli]MBW5287597.1 hypothetical protein [Burkholderia gladioli]